MNLKNLILNSDSYKSSHYLQYPPNSTIASSYIESRGGRFNNIVFFGLQMFIKEYLLDPITKEDVFEAQDIIVAHGLPFNYNDWMYIVEEYGGYLPIEIEALPEGSIVGIGTPLVQVKNTDPKLYWLPSYIETALLRAIWYPTTVATYSYECKKVIKNFLELTGCSLDGLEFKLHDFGARGVSSLESAGIGGLSHLVNFKGSDTITSMLYGKKYYNEGGLAFSIPAAEHSTITSWGKNNELEAYRNMFKQFGSNTFAVVTDSYDHFNAIRHMFGDLLSSQVSDNPGLIVFRPDSGDATEIVPLTIKSLMDKFGYTHTQTGHLLLPNNIRVIQGDGVSIDSIKTILTNMHNNNLAADNIAFGMGAELLQKTNRDIQRFAMKMSAIEVDKEWRDVYKDPITSPNKRSKKGIQAVYNDSYNEVSYKAIRLDCLGPNKNMLRVVYRNGQLFIDETFTTIRERVI